MEEKIRRLVEWAKGNPQGPVSIHLDPTNRCNLRCRFCWQRSHERLGWLDRENELPERKLLEIVKEAAKLGVQDWLISGGGEPFVRTDTTTRVMVEIKKYRMWGDIITNGTLLKEKHIKNLVKAEWDVMRFSINSPYEQNHDFLVNGKGAFQRAINNIKLIQRWKEKLGKEKPTIGFNTVITSANYTEFPELVELLCELGGKILNVQTIILYSKEEEIWTLNEKQKKESQKYLRKAKRLAEKYGIRHNLDGYLEKDVLEKTIAMDGMTDLGMKELKKIKHPNPFVKSYCFEPYYLVTIRANGIVGSCRLFGDSGDSIHDKTLRDVWFGEYFNNARKTLLKGPQPFCSKCGSNEFLENRKIRLELMKWL
ncbi:MAG: radical SAM protein [Candidatus Aenigmarchaeota archaeon]|nr:radical SAM protein [Candidatus Aenigmarchaeota archaeon]